MDKAVFWSFVVEYYSDPKKFTSNNPTKKEGVDCREILIENLTLAWYKAQKGKSHKPDIILFRIQLDKNIQKLSADLKDKKVTFDPKERLICAVAFEDRVLLHKSHHRQPIHPIFLQLLHRVQSMISWTLIAKSHPFRRKVFSGVNQLVEDIM